MEQRLVKLSRTMSYALRHEPAAFGLQLDPEGWVQVSSLLEALRRYSSMWRNIDVRDFSEVIAQSEKRRFEMREGRIRACYGHSVESKIVKEEAVPPETLFHGTTPTIVSKIQHEGLKAMKRQYVHLSTDRETAMQVALRRTASPVILHVDARRAHEQGLKFYLGNDNIWLADVVPPEFIRLEEG